MDAHWTVLTPGYGVAGNATNRHVIEILYISTVLLYVYRLRSKGRPQMPSEVVEQPVHGILSYDQGPREYYARGVMVARVLDPEDARVDMLPPIDNARIERLRGFIQVRGIEYFQRSLKSRTDRWEQSWVCCLTEDDGMRLMLAAERRRRSGVPLDRWPREVSAALARAAAAEAAARHKTALADRPRRDALQAEEDKRMKNLVPAVAVRL